MKKTFFIALTLMLGTCTSVTFAQGGLSTKNGSNGYYQVDTKPTNDVRVMVKTSQKISPERDYYVQESPIYPVNQGSFEFRQHIVMPGESIRQIARIYSGSEDVTNLLVDNQFLQYRARFNKWGRIVNYAINPGDRLTVRIYGSQPLPIRDTTVISNSADFVSGPVFWIMLAFLIALLIAVCIIIGFLMNRRNNTVVYNGFVNPAQPLLIPPISTVRHIHNHQHNFGKFSPIRVVMAAPAAPIAQQEEKK